VVALSETARGSGTWRGHLIAIIVLLVAISASYRPVLDAGFINYDDPKFISENIPVSAGLTWQSVRWAMSADFFTFTPHVEYWEPLVVLSRLMDFSLHGKDAGGHHLTSLIIHILNAILLYALLLRLRAAWGLSVLGALWFGLHPLNVEAVAWLSARKDLLAGTFTLLVALAYVHYGERTGARRYLVLLLAYCLAAMTKPSVMVVPALLLVLDFWPLRRKEGWRRLLLEKLPLAAIAVLVAVLAWISQRGFGAFQTTESLPVLARIPHSMINVALYLKQWIAPLSLSVYYPIPAKLAIGSWLAAGCLLAVLTFLAVKMRDRFPCILAGWLWFLTGLAPVIGLTGLGSSRMADRYMYVPMIGLIAAVLFLPWPRWLAKPVGKRVALAVCGMALIALGWLSHAQAGRWQDSATFFAHAVKLTPDSSLMNLQLANGLLDQGRYHECVAVSRHGLDVSPNNARIWRVLGAALGRSGHANEAIRAMDKAIQLDGSPALFFVERGELLAGQGKMDLGLADMNHAVEMAPDEPRCYRARALVLAQMLRWPEALADGRAMLDLWPHNAAYVVDVSRLLHQAGNDRDALSLLSENRALLARDPAAAGQARVLVEQIAGRPGS
jgi:Flp pilus assembly protein TadD